MMEILKDQLVPEPQVDASRHLFARLEARELDLVIGLDPPSRPYFNAVPLHSVQLQWMSAPGFGQHTREILQELGYPPRDIEALYAEGTVR